MVEFLNGPSPLYRGNLPLRNSPEAKCHLCFLNRFLKNGPVFPIRPPDFLKTAGFPTKCNSPWYLPGKVLDKSPVFLKIAGFGPVGFAFAFGPNKKKWVS